MNRNIRSVAFAVALAVVLVVGIMAQQKSADTAVDPVCGMTVVKATAKGTFDYKGSTYYFCNTGCRDAFAKEPEKYLKAQAEKAESKPAMGVMQHMTQAATAASSGGCACQGGCECKGACACQGGCAMMGQGGMMAHKMPMMRGRMGMPGRGPMAPALGLLFRLYGDKIEVAVENSKDGAALKVTSKDPEVVKAIQVHMAEHIALMKKMKEAAAKAPVAATGVKAPAEAACPDCAIIR